MIAILVPVLGRAHQIEPLLSNLAETTEHDYTVTLICSPKDDEVIEVAKRSDADTIIVPWRPGKADFARKINLAYRHIEAEWYFQGATDLLFHPRWDEYALRMAGTRYGVVGTNDQGNALVKRGLHSTHTFFSRHYIERYGGTLDKSGVVFSEAYDHQYTDNEFVQTAIKRRQFVFARRSNVEHLHPHWGKAEMDATYDKALRDTQGDKMLFASRYRDLIRRR